MAIDYLKSNCNEQLLRSYLGHELTADQEAELEGHLDQCPYCRERIRASAADEHWWAAAGNYLKRDDVDEIAESCSLPAEGAWAACGAGHNQVILRQIREWLDPTDDPRYIGRFGGYEILGVVGFGMGVVLKGFEPSLNRFVAIKILAPSLATSGAARQRFAREAQAAAAVLHENVISIHRVDQSHGLPYLVMPFVSGLSLQRRIDDEGSLPLTAVLRIGRQIAAGLAAAHAQGLVHRDIKPANILLDRGVERVTITDFGLARAADDGSLTKTGVIAGTPQYMSPEQSLGEAIDARSDLFSLGSVLYAMCTGRPPFRAETGYATLRRVTDDQPRPIREINPEIPEWLCRLIGKLMAKQAGDRYQSAAEVAELLEVCLAHVQQPEVAKLPASLQPANSSSRFSFLSRSRSRVLVMIAAIGLGLLGLLAWQATEAPDIAGNWSGEEWGQVVLKRTADGEYSGTYTDTFKERLGTIVVKWSRLERRYKGAWREGDKRSGKISLRLVDDEIHGAWTTSRKSEINPGTPELADLTWKRLSAARVEAEPPGPQTLADAARQFNAETAQVRKELFTPPILDLPVERLREGFRQTANLYRRQGKLQIADALEKIADSAQLPKEATGGLIGTGVHAQDGEGRTVSRQIVPGLVLPDNSTSTGSQLVLLRPLELIYRKDGPVSKDYGDQFEEKRENGSEVVGRAQQLHGTVTDLKEQELVEISLGADDGVREGDVLYVFRAQTYLGKIIIQRPAAEKSIARIDSRNGDIHRGDRVVTAAPPVEGSAVRRTKADETPLWNAFGVTRDPVLPFTAKVLEWCGLHLNPITKGEFRDKNVLAKYSGGLDVSFVRSHGPAENAGINEVDIVVGLQGRPLTSLQELDAAIKAAVDQVKRGEADALQWDVLRDGETIRINVPFPARDLALEGSAAAPGESDSDSRAALPTRLHRFITDEKVKLVACSPDGKFVAVATDQSTLPSPQIDWKRAALIMNADSGKVVKLQITTRAEYSQLAANKGTPRSEVTAIVFSPDGSLVAIGTSLGQVKLFDARTGEDVAALDDEKARPADNEILRKLTAVKRAMGSISSLAFSPDGGLLAACGGSFEDVPFDESEGGRLGAVGPGRVTVWEVTGTLKRDLVGQSYAGAVAFSADGKLLASAGSWFGPQRGSGVIVWDPERGERQRTIDQTTNGGVHCVVFGPEKTLLAFAALEFDKDSEMKTTKIILAHAGSGIVQWQQSIPRGATVKGFSADGKSIAVLSSGRSIEFFDAETGQARHEINLASSPETLRWADLSVAAKGNVLAVGGVGKDRQGSVEIWAVPAAERALDSEAPKNIDTSLKSGD
jgi:serine/threonine protein kinase/WD40 repeat protein